MRGDILSPAILPKVCRAICIDRFLFISAISAIFFRYLLNFLFAVLSFACTSFESFKLTFFIQRIVNVHFSASKEEADISKLLWPIMKRGGGKDITLTVHLFYLPFSLVSLQHKLLENQIIAG